MVDRSVSTDSLGRDQAAAVDSPPKKKLKIAIVGCGGISELHIQALRSMADVDIVAGVDIKPRRLQVMQQKFSLTHLYDDYLRMLAEVKPDAVSVCTPNSLHAPMAVHALQAGAHVITEKPMAMNPIECRQMLGAAKKSGRKLAVGFQYRYHPHTQMLVRARDSGQFGDVMFVKCQALRRRGIPNWGVFGRKELQGGGPMIDLGVHVMEMAHYMMGSPRPVSAAGNIWTYLGHKPGNVASMWPGWDHATYNVEDLAVGHIRFENGAVMQVEASFAAHIAADIWNFSFMGTRGGGSWDPPTIHTDSAGTMVNITPAFLPSGDFAGLISAKLRNFVDACLYDAELMAPGEAGLDVQAMIDGVYRAAACGHEVDISTL